jgi:putative inorganic carbon (hco3(-)) transporter
MGGGESGLAAASRSLSLALVATVPLAAWPGLELPFSAPKLWLLCVGTLALLALAMARGTLGRAVLDTPALLRWSAFAWAASFAWSGALAPFVARESLALGLAGPALWLALVVSGATGTQLRRATVAAAALVAMGAVAQWAGHDPFAAGGWTATIRGGSERLRVYGTLGNPNFVAAWLSMAVPAALALLVQAAGIHRRTEAALAGIVLLLCVAGIAMTGSRGGALGLAVGLSAFAALTARAPRRWWRLPVGLLLAGGLALGLVQVSTARPLTETLAGRAYIWRVVAPHALDRAVAGWGPGSFELVYHDWQGTAPTHASATVFAGPQQRAHNDYLEALVERGLPGVAATCLLVGAVVVIAVRRTRRGTRDVAAAGAASAVLAIAAVALVDFPLARPAEVTALWAAIAALTLETKDAS